MKTEHMREFVELVKTKNYNRTAEKLYISQSSISKHVAQMEEELGTDLMNRTNHGFELTEVGQYVFDQCEKLLCSFDNMVANVNEIKSGMKGQLKIGIPYYVSEKCALPILKRMKEYPKINIRTVSKQPDQIFNDLTEGKIDAGIIFFIPAMKMNFGDDIQIFPIYVEDAVLLHSANTTLSQNGSLDISALAGEKFIRYESGPYMKIYNDAVLKWLHDQGIDFSEIVPLDNVDFLSSVISETGAISIMPGHIRDTQSRWKTLDLKGFPRISTCLFFHKTNSNPALKLFCSIAYDVWNKQS
jgi:DNA-binding transcriptional LysR family regulator